METPYSQFTTSRSLLYSYLHIAPTGSLPYILLLHGFPSCAHDWHHQITHFHALGYGIIAPDLLGYGDSSKPLDVTAYKGKAMADDMAELLHHEKISSVVCVAHDWGSFLLSRLANYHPNLLSKLAFLDVGYSSPDFGLTTEAIGYVNAGVQAAKGYSIFGYFLFFAEDDAATLLDANSHSVRSLFYTEDDDIKKKYMGAPGGFRTWLQAGQQAPPEPWATETDKTAYDKALAGGYAAPINWYRASLQNISAAEDAQIPAENKILSQPTLLITSSNFISAAADFPAQMKASAPKLVVEHIDCGHWIQLERPDETNKALEKFLNA